LALEIPQNYRKRPRQARSRRTVGTLLDATETVLRSHGYLGASTNRIARAAGISVGSLYQYFGDKDGLIGAALERALAREAEALAVVADAARGRPLPEGTARVVEAVIESRIGQRALLAVLAEHGLRFGPGTTLQVVSKHQRSHPDPVQRLLAGRRAELCEVPLDTLRFSTSSLLNVSSFAYAVESPPALPSATLSGLLGAAITGHLTRSGTPRREPPREAPRRLDPGRLQGLLEGACRSSAARAALFDELVFEEQCALDAVCAATDGEPSAVCEGMLRFWAETSRSLARAAGAATLTSPCLDPEAFALRAARRAQRLRSWLGQLHGGASGAPVEAAVFVLGHAFLELGLLFAQSREPEEVVEEHLADVAALLGHCARLAGDDPIALTSSAYPQ
jgi:AcrR family transcriptional regulator